MSQNKQTRITKLAARLAAALLLVLTAIAFNSGGVTSAQTEQEFCKAMTDACVGSGGKPGRVNPCDVARNKDGSASGVHLCEFSKSDTCKAASTYENTCKQKFKGNARPDFCVDDPKDLDALPWRICIFVALP